LFGLCGWRKESIEIAALALACPAVGSAASRWVIAIRKRIQLPNTLPIISMLNNWHYQLK
jgi:hypothetical protein